MGIARSSEVPPVMVKATPLFTWSILSSGSSNCAESATARVDLPAPGGPDRAQGAAGSASLLSSSQKVMSTQGAGAKDPGKKKDNFGQALLTTTTPSLMGWGRVKRACFVLCFFPSLRGPFLLAGAPG